MSTLSDRHAIVGEIGSTHLRFALADVDELTMDHYVSFRTSDFDSIELALNAYLISLPCRPGRMSLAVAGDVAEGQAHLAHLPWIFTDKRLQDAFGVPVVNLMSDIRAVSLAVPLLAEHELLRVAATVSPQPGPKAVVLIERDIETAIIVPNGRDWKVTCGRAADITFGVEDADELLVLNTIRSHPGRITVGKILTSTGLAALHDALRLRAGLNPSGWNISEITTAASLDERDPFAKEAVERFAAWLGRFAGDLAAAYGASGGVYLVGSLPNDLRDFLTDGPFRASFARAGGPSGFASTVPVYIVKAFNVGLRGATLALS
ncbi:MULTISPECIES: glucokinase [Rhizobium]|uniref:Uncharacterized protein n=1 Tax=Rhizobium leguminosarum bv. viciae TaxID=387 RepID=A0A8G2IX55_RHILV|nr:glucokinase [Rhizobium leguminosarum]MBY5323762.1 hypothetical protein [Rhizobium leguminosarum]MBY5384729.1 hypothetical protein [Rhizobium leguminosarum]MBY5426457.1 hypothetical protein [Rhizobium leguminosarum]MCA2435476.1 glucokinase [Rhizobium leguminosarum]NEH45709.1 hypothetical protein [Rhizobium leguminosarum]